MQAVAAAKPLLTDDEFKRLKERVSKSYAALEPQRRNRLKTLKQYVGNSLGTAGDGPEMYTCVVNMLDEMVEVYMQKLVSGNPQCLILSNKIDLKAQCRYFQMAVNHVLKQINLRDSLKTAVMESLFSMMIMKVGVENPEYTDRQYPFDVSAVPFADPVWFEDWVHDTTASRLSECKFLGDKFRESKDSILNDPRNDKEVAQNCKSGPASAFDSGTGHESASDLGGHNQGFNVDDQDDVWLWSIYDRRKRLVVTYPMEGSDKPLRVEKWTGHPEGPYRVGRYKEVLNQIMPKPPAVDGAPLADLDNRLMEKLGEQASRQKTIGVATMSATKDAQAVIRASDGEVINVTHPEAVKQMNFGGVDQGNLTFDQIVQNRASDAWGNLKTMGGTAPGADTLGQEQMMQQSSSARIQMMQQTITNVTKDVIIAIAWYLWNDPLVRVSVMDRLPQTSIEFEIQWPKEVDEFGQERDLRQGEFNDLNFEIVPYSLSDMPPNQRMAVIDQTVMQLAQMAPLLTPAGVTINFRAYVEAKKRLMGITEMDEIIQEVDAPVQPEEELANTMPTKPASTTRTYDRRSTKGDDDSNSKLIGGMGSTKQGGVV